MAKITTIPFPLCEKVLPTVYDNTLSYYEQVCKLTKCCQEIVDTLTDWSGTIAELQEAIVDIDDMKRQIATLDGELVSLTGRVNENYVELKGLISELDKLVNDSVKDMENRVKTVELSLSNLTQTIYNVNNHLQKEIDDLRTELIALIDSKYVDFEDRLDMLQLKFNQFKVNIQGQIDDINKRLDEIDTTALNPWHPELGKVSLDKNVKLMYNDLSDSVPTAEDYSRLGLTASEYTSFGLRAIDYVRKGKERLHYYWVYSPAYGWLQEINNVLTSIIDYCSDTISADEYTSYDLTADEYSAIGMSAIEYYKFKINRQGRFVPYVS